MRGKPRGCVNMNPPWMNARYERTAIRSLRLSLYCVNYTFRESRPVRVCPRVTLCVLDDVLGGSPLRCVLSKVCVDNLIQMNDTLVWERCVCPKDR